MESITPRIPNQESSNTQEPQKPTIKPHRSCLGNRVYQSHPEMNKYAIEDSRQITKSSNLETGSNTDESKKLIMDSKDSSTQTSKTILQLAKLEGGKFSPDSLTPSPREYTQNISNPTYNVGPENHQDPYSVSFVRKNLLRQYLDEYEIDACDSVAQGTIYPKKSLTETFLEKRQNEVNTCNCRSQFLQQTSPLRNINCQTFKSQSYVEAPELVFVLEPEKHKSVPTSRFTVKNVKRATEDSKPSIAFKKLSHRLQNSPTNIQNSKRCAENTIQNVTHCEGHTTENKHCNINASVSYSPGSPKDLAQISPPTEISDMMYSSTMFQQSPRTYSPSRSFMSPTFASEQRNQQRFVKETKQLISPTRRGKSLSPRRFPFNQPKFLKRNNTSKVPYIDGSKTTVVTTTKEYNMSPCRRTITHDDISSSPGMRPLKVVPTFEEDLLKIDLQSLNLKSSEETLPSAAPVSSSSTVSSDNIIFVTLTHIKNHDWSIALKGLAEMTEICRIMDYDSLYPHMITVNQRLLELLKSPRSHVCRTACQAAGNFFESMKDTRRPEFDDIVENLLCRTADSNKFIRMDANLALDCMVTHIPIFHSIKVLCLKGPTHKNALVRTATIRLMVCAVVITGAEAILTLPNHEHTKRRIVQYMAKFLEDKHVEIRKYAVRLYKVFSKEPNFDSNLKKFLEKEDIARMKNTLKSMNVKR